MPNHHDDPLLPIIAPRLALLPMTPPFLAASLQGEIRRAEQLLGLQIHPEWLTATFLMDLRLAQLRTDPLFQPWSLRAIRRADDGMMIGHIGCHDRPGSAYLRHIAPGGIEFGYTIYTPFRRHGYAREATAALMRWAMHVYHIRLFVLSIAPNNEPSQRIARHFHFVRTGSHVDDLEGLEDIYVRSVGALFEL